MFVLGVSGYFEVEEEGLWHGRSSAAGNYVLTGTPVLMAVWDLLAMHFCAQSFRASCFSAANDVRSRT